MPTNRNQLPNKDWLAYTCTGQVDVVVLDGATALSSNLHILLAVAKATKLWVVLAHDGSWDMLASDRMARMLAHAQTYFDDGLHRPRRGGRGLGPGENKYRLDEQVSVLAPRARLPDMR